jgi:nucleoside-diphosphate-sugar epimerase
MASVLVTGGTGFIGRELAPRLVRQGFEVFVLTRRPNRSSSMEGVHYLVGDLTRKGEWQKQAADVTFVVHLAQPRAFGGRVTKARAEAYREGRLAMDSGLFAAVGSARTILYVAGTSYYGDTGRELVDEDTAPRPRGWGPYIKGALDQAEARARAGLPIVLAFPGYVYGDGSWFREYVLRPLRSGAPIHVLGGRSRIGSPVHVSDCARALIYLLEHGKVGARYFVVDDAPQEWSTFYGRAAQAAGIPLRVRTLSPRVLRLLVGPVVTDSLSADAALSNARLRSLGFQLDFPTTATGIPDVVSRARPTEPLPGVVRTLWNQVRERFNRA